MGIKQKIKFSHPWLYRLLNRTFPKTIQIQTTSVCNANCDFCPYPVVSQEVSMGKMTPEVFEKTVCGARQLGVSRFALYLMNEPFVDPLMPERIAYVKKLGGTPILSTNAALMTPEIGEKSLAAGLEELVVNMPSADPQEFKNIVSKLDFEKVISNLESLSQYQKHYPTNVCIQVNVAPNRAGDLVEKTIQHWESLGLDVTKRLIHDRAGNLGAYPQDRFIRQLKGCSDFRDVSNLHVLFNGDVILCCMDWRRTVTLGNVTRHSLKHIYFDRPYFRVRKELRGLAESSNDFICRKCEFAQGNE